VLDRVQAADHRRLVEPDAEPVAELQPEAGLLVGEALLLGRGPDAGDLVSRHAGAHQVDRRVQPLAALLVGIELGLADAAHVERAVVARPVAHERVDDVEERLVARAQQAIGEDVRVRVAAVAGHRVDRLDLLRAKLEEQPLGIGHDLVLADAGAQRAVDLVVDGVDDSRRVVEQRDLVDGLDAARAEHHARAVGDVDARALQCLEGDHVRDVAAERLAFEAVLAQLVRDALPERVGDAGLDRHRPAHGRHAGAEVLGGQPLRVHLVMTCGRAEVPQDRVAVARQENIAGVLVPRPFADVRAGDVADVVGVEEQQRPEVGGLERLLGPLQALGAQPREVDALLPVDGHRRAARCDVHARSPDSMCSVAVNMPRNSSRLADSASS
jgi:hypothetical protein